MEKLKVNTFKIKTPIAIIGLGVSGRSALHLLLSLGVPRPEIATFDQREVADFSTNEDLMARFHPNTLIVSPGVPLSSPWIQDFKKSGGTVTNELSLALGYLTTEKVIAVTGSLGKSTVVSLLQVGLSTFSENSFVGGNLGTPLSEYVVKFLQTKRRADWVVLELSSYQLENCENLKCDFAAITYLTPNHLERYQDLNGYYATKWALLEHTHGPLVLNARGGDLKAFSQKNRTLSSTIWTDRTDSILAENNLEHSLLLGSHNQDNLAVAARLAQQAAWPRSAIEEMKTFRGLPHRVENLGLVSGVTYVNDSKATTMESVKTAVESLRPSVGGQIHLLLGGRDKALPWEQLQSLEHEAPIHFYFFGECRSTAHHKSKLTASEFPSMRMAFEAARAVAKFDDLILLSPGGTSLDEFKNFEERGDFFRKLVLAN